MEKYDVKRAHKALYAPGTREFVVVEVPAFRYLAVDGQGDPNTSSEYTEALAVLYATAYGLKFASKNELGRDFVVAPLEGLWWAKNMVDFTSRNKDRWEWTVLINQPEWITPELFSHTVKNVAAKKDLPGMDRLHVADLDEGRCTQILHIGPYDDEAPTLARLHNEFMPRNKLQFNGKHHEIYLSDPRRTVPEKLKTILRQPVADLLVEST